MLPMARWDWTRTRIDLARVFAAAGISLFLTNSSSTLVRLSSRLKSHEIRNPSLFDGVLGRDENSVTIVPFGRVVTSASLSPTVTFWLRYFSRIFLLTSLCSGRGIHVPDSGSHSSLKLSLTVADTKEAHDSRYATSPANALFINQYMPISILFRVDISSSLHAVSILASRISGMGAKVLEHRAERRDLLPITIGLQSSVI